MVSKVINTNHTEMISMQYMYSSIIGNLYMWAYMDILHTYIEVRDAEGRTILILKSVQSLYIYK